MITTDNKTKIIKKYRTHTTDTGSPEVQVAVASERIKELAKHLKNHPKDVDSKRGLLELIAKRKKILIYLEKKFPKRYNSLIKNIKI